MRRSHTKSRKGCLNCKRRKVKCDEAHPACFNCKRYGVSCSLGGNRESMASLSSHNGSRIALPAMQPNLTSPTPAPSPNSDAGPPTDMSGSSIVGLGLFDHPNPCLPQELWGREMELMHHYCTETANTISLRGDMCHVWNVIVPRIGYSHPFVTHGILAIAAVHKSGLVPSNRETYLRLAAYHQMVGSKSFRQELQRSTRENSMALFSFASAVVLYMFTLPSRLQSRQLEDPITSFVELVKLLQGIETILNPIHSFIRATEFAPLIDGAYPVECDDSLADTPSLENTNLPHDMWEALQRLRIFHEEEISAPSIVYYRQLMDQLEETIKLVTRAGIHAESGAILGCLYTLHSSIILDLMAHQSRALPFLAYYSVLLVSVERNFWYTRGWGKRLLAEVELMLAGQPKYLSMIQWPIKAIDELYRTPSAPTCRS
ncbi:hypothetical protein B0T10DRAFT_498842 [Thelonectria olida]|uniref:Zn(2)-C6 fungal-type domain-containing protein n=1 Tax=Thelonectria olida TaxID=1576542 RepID=A0A9P8VTF1_9HYPO|nr:hypothetical protein B0T10DRAFT_498842 [Thelonectria olida]